MHCFDRECATCKKPFVRRKYEPLDTFSNRKHCSIKCFNFKHGLHKSKEYLAWASMIQRCHNPSNSSYPGYGAKGISVCQRWRDNFINFYEDMGPRPSNLHSIDRIDNNKGYSPCNCRWADRDKQQSNKSTNKNVTYNGVTKCVAHWEKALGMNKGTLRERFKRGWSVEQAIETPVAAWNRPRKERT